MSTFPKQIWAQLKNITIQDLEKALQKDGWKAEERRGATMGYRKDSQRRVVLHMHPKATKGPKLLKELLGKIGWTEADLRRLKLIK